MNYLERKADKVRLLKAARSMRNPGSVGNYPLFRREYLALGYIEREAYLYSWSWIIRVYCPVSSWIVAFA